MSNENNYDLGFCKSQSDLIILSTENLKSVGRMQFQMLLTTDSLFYTGMKE